MQLGSRLGDQGRPLCLGPECLGAEHSWEWEEHAQVWGEGFACSKMSQNGAPGWLSR